jgi:hypothetical protein
MWIQGEVNLHKRKRKNYVGGSQNGAWMNHMEQISQDWPCPKFGKSY